MPAPKKWTDEEVKAEIAAAVQIVSEDRERASYARLHEKYGKAASDPPGDAGSDPASDGSAPPKKEGEAEPDLGESPKRSLWWGDATE